MGVGSGVGVVVDLDVGAGVEISTSGDDPFGLHAVIGLHAVKGKKISKRIETEKVKTDAENEDRAAKHRADRLSFIARPPLERRIIIVIPLVFKV